MSLRISIVGMGHTGTQAARRLLAAEPDIALTVYDIDPDGDTRVCHVERWDYAAATHAFAPVDKTLVAG